MKISIAEAFNIKYPLGTRVRYWSVLPKSKLYPSKETKTRSEAWDIGDDKRSITLVMVEGIAGGVALTHIEAI